MAFAAAAMAAIQIAQTVQAFSQNGKSGTKLARRQADLSRQEADVRAVGTFFAAKMDPDDPRTAQYVNAVESLAANSAGPGDEQSEAARRGSQLLFEEYRDYALKTGVLLPFPSDSEMGSFIQQNGPQPPSDPGTWVRNANLGGYASQLEAIRPQADQVAAQIKAQGNQPGSYNPMSPVSGNGNQPGSGFLDPLTLFPGGSGSGAAAVVTSPTFLILAAIVGGLLLLWTFLRRT